jgi:pilus assembly protein CpaB
MRRGRILIFVVLILIIGLIVAAVAVRQFLLPAVVPTQVADFVQIYRTSQPIPQGGDITSDVITTMSIPRTELIESEFTVDESAQLTTGKVARFPLDQGVVLTESMIVDKSSAVSIAGPQWAALIPPGMTAISVPTSRLSLAGYGINDGAHVNINACFMFVDVDPTFQTILPNLTAVLTGTGFGPDALPVLSLGVGAAGAAQGRLELEPSLQQPYYLIPAEAQRPRKVCQMLLQDVVVMKLGNFPLASSTTTQPPAEQGAQPAAPAAPDIVTLIVSPQDSVTLSYLIYSCDPANTTVCSTQIQMTLRNPSDQARQATEASTLQFLLSQYNIPVPAKLPYALQPTYGILSGPSLPNDTTTVTPQ